MDKHKLSRKVEAGGMGENGRSNATVTLETLHRLAASYFIDRESTLRRLHHIQIATAAIKVTLEACQRAVMSSRSPVSSNKLQGQLHVECLGVI